MGVVPWFPGARLFARWSAAGRLVGVPAHERLGGLEVHHPRVFYVPRVGHALAPALYAGSLWPAVSARRGKVDVVLGSWAFPDGAAAVTLARLLGVPAVVKLHGSDLNVLAELPPVERCLRLALPRADRVVAVSRGLSEKAQALGVRPERIAIVPNGVDRELFHPQDRAAARRELGLPADRPLALYVGRLERAKGTEERSRVDGCWLGAPDVHKVTNSLIGMSYAERVAQPCIGQERADLVLAGCAILEALLRIWPCQRLRVADRGLREGILSTLMAEDGHGFSPRNRHGRWPNAAPGGR